MTTARRSTTRITPVAIATAPSVRRSARRTGWSARGRDCCPACDHYLLTFTLPQSLRAIAFAHQQIVYAALLREAAAAVQTLADDRAWVGGTPGILAVLHTWSRTMEYHPHTPLLVTAGGLSPDGTAWVTPAHPRFLMPGYARSAIFRAKMRDTFERAALLGAIDPTVWTRPWTVHGQQIGSGAHATRYLARYVYHVALTNHRLESFAHGRVTFRYTHARTHETRRVTLPVDPFIARFLQHVLPQGFTKVRSYGLLSPTGRPDLARARHLLTLPADVRVHAARDATRHDGGHATIDTAPVALLVVIPAVRHCPACGRGALRLVARYQRSRAPPA